MRFFFLFLVLALFVLTACQPVVVKTANEECICMCTMMTSVVSHDACVQNCVDRQIAGQGKVE